MGEPTLHTGNGWAFGPFTVEPIEGRLARHGQPVALTRKAFDTLVVLLTRRGRLVSRHDLLDLLWPDCDVDEANLTSTVWMIRRALGGPTAWIETVPKRGYRFVGDVQDITTPGGAGQSAVFVRTLAVLPFCPLVSSQRDDVLEVGLADTLITRLSTLRDVVVRPINAVRSYRGIDADPVAIGRQLAVDAVVEGSLQRDGSSVRVTARLRAIPSGQMMWAQSFDISFRNLFALEDAIAEQVASALELSLSGEERSRLIKRHASNIQAYQLYLEGRDHWHRWPSDGYERSLECFQDAIAVDPEYADAHVGLAHYFGLGAAMGVLRPASAWPRVEIATATALRLDNTLSSAHNANAALRLYVHRDWLAAEQSFRQALDLNSGDAETRNHYGLSLGLFGRIDEAVAQLQRAIEMDPLAIRFHRNLGFVMYQAGRYDDAIEACERALNLDPAYAYAWELLGDACEQKGVLAEAPLHWRRAARTAPYQATRAAAEEPCGPGIDAALQELWRPRLHDMERRLAEGEFVPAMQMARAHARLGNADHHVQAWLREAADERSRLILELPLDPQFNRYRGMLWLDRILDGLPNGRVSRTPV